MSRWELLSHPGGGSREQGAGDWAVSLGKGSNPVVLLVALTCGSQSIYCVPTMRKVLGTQPRPSQPLSYDIKTRGGSFSCHCVKCCQRQRDPWQGRDLTSLGMP